MDAMASWRRLLLIAPLVVSVGVFAKAPRREKPTKSTVPASTRCYMRCMDPFTACKKKCGPGAKCVSACSKDMGKCSDKCGGPPPEMKQG